MALLSLSAQEAARRVAIGLCREAAAAATRFTERSDPEALHDLRVALRRLRSVLKAFAEPLAASLTKKRLVRLRDLAQATGDARDAEVQVRWADQMLDGSLEPEVRSAVAYLREHWAARRDAGFLRIDEAVLPRLGSLLPKIERALLTYATEHVVFEERPEVAGLAPTVARIAREECAALVDCLGRVGTIEEESLAHQARLHGKRLRYVLEPFRSERADVDDAVRTLRGLQEILGALNDRAVRVLSITRALEALATSHVRDLAKEALEEWTPESEVAGDAVQPGLLLVLRGEGARRLESFDALISGWTRGPGLSRLEASIDALSRDLATPAMPLEIERKYLLRSLPPRALEAPSVRMEQGYLPGEKLIERVRRISSDAGVEHVRTVKLGKGVSRIEVEETCSRVLFHKLWPLTKGRRVEKVRYRVPEGELAWEIDAFTDRKLFLAEIELPSADHEVVLPAWLAPHVVRDVTDESKYVNARLAR